MGKTYIAIDLKSFYASSECVDRGLDPLKTNLVVADVSRTEKTICLAVSPSLKAYGIGGRARLFEVIQRVKEVNKERLKKAPNHKFSGKSYFSEELNSNPSLELDYIAAPPQMQRYVNVSAKIYSIYLRYVSPDDIHVYSIDEVFIDATDYLKLYKLSAHDFAMKLVKEVLKETGITATAGIGTNLFLCKIAMDIVAKHKKADADGVRIAELDEITFRKELWEHEPLTDFWRIGPGIRERLEKNGMFCLGDVALKSVNNEDLLYKLFGINAELIIDHAWGYESTTIKDIKQYKPVATSLSSGQVLSCGYTYEKTKLIVKEMCDLLVLDLVDKNLVTDQIILHIGYDVDNLKNNDIKKKYKGVIALDYLGREVPQSARGSINLGKFTSSTKLILEKTLELFDSIINPILLSRRINIVANHTMDREKAPKKKSEYVQLSFFEDEEKKQEELKRQEKEEETENKLQKVINNIHKKYGKNAILKGMNLEEGATTKERNGQIGGHKK